MEQGRHRAPSTGGPEGPVWVRGPPGPGRAGSSHHQAVSGGNQAPADPDRPTRSQMGGDAQAESGAQGHQQGLRGGEPEEARQETHVAPPPQPAEGRVAEIPRGRRDDAVGGDVPGFLRVLPGRRTDSSTRGGVPGTGPPDSCGHSDGPRQPPSMADCLGETIQDGPAPAGCTSDGGQDGPAPMPGGGCGGLQGYPGFRQGSVLPVPGRQPIDQSEAGRGHQTGSGQSRSGCDGDLHPQPPDRGSDDSSTQGGPGLGDPGHGPLEEQRLPPVRPEGSPGQGQALQGAGQIGVTWGRDADSTV